MTRFERILHDDSRLCWLLKAIIVVLMVVWAPQLKLHHVPTGREMALEKHNVVKMCQFLDPIYDRAKALGNKYGKSHFMADLDKIELKDKELGYPGKNIARNVQPVSTGTVEELRTFALNSSNADSVVICERVQQTGDQSLVKTLRHIGWTRILQWSIVFYLRMMLLSLFLFLVRMIERKGILATILADKRAFILAPFGWIYYIWKYPHNVIREIRVEAELRRLGRFFRRLDPKEQEKVREIANSSRYSEWLAQHRQQHGRLFRRGLIVALLGTIMLHLLVPLLGSQQKTKMIRGPAINQAQSGSGGKILYESRNQNHQDQNGSGASHAVCLPNPWKVSHPSLIYWSVWVDPPRTQERIKAIDHVPDPRPVVSLATN